MLTQVPKIFFLQATVSLCTATLVIPARLQSAMSCCVQVLAQFAFFRNLMVTEANKTDVYLLPEQLGEKMAALHIPTQKDWQGRRCE